MSDYWKSTPKYWCKQCGTYVRDTKLERANHEATGKHQGNLRRFLRGIHKENEKQERDQLRAKDEIARLNGPQTNQKQAFSQPSKTSVGKVPPRIATKEERQAQMMQLAAMGVAVPEQYRQDLAITGEWQVVAERVVGQAKHEIFETVSAKALGSIDLDIPTTTLKRRANEADLADEDTGRKVAWGSATKSLRVFDQNDTELNSLLSGSKLSSKTMLAEDVQGSRQDVISDGKEDAVAIKLEKPVATESGISYKTSSENEITGDDQIIFKKRRKKENRT